MTAFYHKLYDKDGIRITCGAHKLTREEAEKAREYFNKVMPTVAGAYFKALAGFKLDDLFNVATGQQAPLTEEDIFKLLKGAS